MCNPQVKELHLFNQVYSMMPSIKPAEYLCEITTGENRVECKQRGREKEKSGLMEREIECWKEMEMAWVGNNH